mgnify:FL=1
MTPEAGPREGNPAPAQAGRLHTTVPACAECGGRLGVPKPGRSICPACHLDFATAQRRRHAAELRTQPLSDLGEAS